jgi:ABC-2 type transport system permease protein
MENLYKKYYRAKISFQNTFIAEWNAIKADKAVVSTFVLVAFALLTVYTYIYSKEVITEVPVAIVNQDATKTSRDYVAMLNATEGVKTILTYSDIQEAKRAYYSKEVMGIVIIPKDFGKNLRSGKKTTVTSFSDASNMVFYSKVLADITVTTVNFNAGIAVKKEMSSGIPIAIAKQNYVPIQPISTSLFNTAAGYATYIIPILTALIIQLIILMGIGILNGSRKEDKTIHLNFPRLLHRGGTIPVLLAKASLYSLIFAVIIPIQIGIIYAIFSIPVRSSLALVYLFSLPYLTSVVFLGIAISSLFKRREDSIVFLVLLSIPSLMLSGLSFPMEEFSNFYQQLAKLLPSTSGITGFVKLTQMEATFNQVLNDWSRLWLLTLFYFVLAVITLKVRARKEKTHLIDA